MECTHIIQTSVIKLVDCFHSPYWTPAKRRKIKMVAIHPGPAQGKGKIHLQHLFLAYDVTGLSSLRHQSKRLQVLVVTRTENWTETQLQKQ
jgi:hypothetical protein